MFMHFFWSMHWALCTFFEHALFLHSQFIGLFTSNTRDIQVSYEPCTNSQKKYVNICTFPYLTSRRRLSPLRRDGALHCASFAAFLISTFNFNDNEDDYGERTQ